MLFSKETIKSYAASKGIQQIEDNAYQVMSQDLEYRIKELCQEATKFMYASHRTKLTIDDINYALIARNIDPLFGYDPNDVLMFKNINNYYYVPDEEIDLEEYLNKPLPKIPLKPTITSHWLAIEGVQPQIPQNPLINEKKDVVNDQLQNYIEDTEIKTTTKHLLTKELQLYFDKINNFVQGDENEREMAFKCLENDSGIQQLLPYFVHLFYETILKTKENSNEQKYSNEQKGYGNEHKIEETGYNTANTTVSNSDRLIQTTIGMMHALLKNKHIFIDPYLHKLIPAILTGVIGNNLQDDTRRIGSYAVKYIFTNYGNTYTSLAPRIINTLKKSWLDKEKHEDIQFGALFCLSLLGDTVKNDVILANIDTYTEEKHGTKISDVLRKIL
ncbi:histone H4-like TAF Taf6 [Binucleata daphniae]